MIENMRGMPILFGGLVLDPEGLAEPRVNGGCEDTACTKGALVIFDKPAHGWDMVELVSTPYPEGRAGHTMTGKSNSYQIASSPQSMIPTSLWDQTALYRPTCIARAQPGQAPSHPPSSAADTSLRRRGPGTTCRRASPRSKPALLRSTLLPAPFPPLRTRVCVRRDFRAPCLHGAAWIFMLHTFIHSYIHTYIHTCMHVK
jgi:hypothetical protein